MRRPCLPCTQALTAHALPPKQLVDACKAWYAVSSDPRVMVPVAFTLSRRDVIGLLPEMLRSLDPRALKKLYQSLAGRHGDGQFFGGWGGGGGGRQLSGRGQRALVLPALYCMPMCGFGGAVQP